MSHILKRYTLESDDSKFPVRELEVGHYDGVPTQSGYLTLKTDATGKVDGKTLEAVINKLQSAASDLSKKASEGTNDTLSASQLEILKDVRFGYGSFDEDRETLAVRFETKADRNVSKDEVATVVSHVAHEAGFAAIPSENIGTPKWVPAVTSEERLHKYSSLARY